MDIDKTPLNKRIVIIPEYIWKAIHRNNLNIVDVTNFSKIRNILSLEDLIDWYEIVMTIKIRNQPICSIDPHSLFKFSSETQSQEFLSALSLKRSDELTSRVTQRLKRPITELEGSKPAYKFVPYPDGLILVVSDTFLTAMNVNEELHLFLKAFVETYSEMMGGDITSLRYLNLYDLYLSELRNKV
jgi:hypothetical protein